MKTALPGSHISQSNEKSTALRKGDRRFTTESAMHRDTRGFSPTILNNIHVLRVPILVYDIFVL